MQKKKFILLFKYITQKGSNRHIQKSETFLIMCFIVKQDYEAKYMNNEPTLLTVNPVSALKQQVLVSGDSEIL